METQDDNITTRTEEKRIWELSFRDWYHKLRGEETVKEIGKEVTLDYDELDYICKSCGESIAPTLDDLDNWGKCPHCGNRHTQKVKSKNGTSNLLLIIGIISAFTLIGALIAPLFWILAGKTNSTAKRRLRKEENRIGHVVDENGDRVEEISDYINEGWTIKSQNADGFTMEKMSYGSRRMHWILVITCFWTLGWANIIYGGYSMGQMEKMFVVTE